MAHTNEGSDYLTNLGIRLRKARTDKHLSMDELAERAGYGNRSSIACIETGKRGLPVEKAIVLAEILEVSPYYLLTGMPNYKDKRDYLTKTEINDAAIMVEQYVTNTRGIELTDIEMQLVYEIKKMTEDEQRLLLKMISKEK